MNISNLNEYRLQLQNKKQAELTRVILENVMELEGVDDETWMHVGGFIFLSDILDSHLFSTEEKHEALDKLMRIKIELLVEYNNRLDAENTKLRSELVKEAND